jgi:hypothetical protein
VNEQTEQTELARVLESELYPDLDQSESSRNGDEFAAPTLDWQAQITERNELDREILALRDIADQSAIDIADALINNRKRAAWAAFQRLHRATVTFSEDYV